MKIPIIFLGTSQAIPTEKRNHTAVLLKYKDETQLFNKGEKVLFRWSLKHSWEEGKVKQVSRLANGQYRYILSYKTFVQDNYDDNSDNVDNDQITTQYTNPMTKKNIKKYE